MAPLEFPMGPTQPVQVSGALAQMGLVAKDLQMYGYGLGGQAVEGFLSWRYTAVLLNPERQHVGCGGDEAVVLHLFGANTYQTAACPYAISFLILALSCSKITLSIIPNSQLNAFC